MQSEAGFTYYATINKIRPNGMNTSTNCKKQKRNDALRKSTVICAKFTSAAELASSNRQKSYFYTHAICGKACNYTAPGFFALPDALANVERPFRVEHYLTVKSFDHDRVQMTYSPSCSTKSLTCNNNRQSGLRSNCKKTNSSVVNKQNKTNSGEVNKRKETHTSDAYKRITD